MQKVTNITYNHLNLPKEIIFNTGNLIRYTYNAMGQKITKTVKTGAEFAVTDYMSGFQYRSSYTEAGGNQEEPRLQYFPTAEGYVEWLDGHPRYVYNYTDHLGNIRLSYAYDENVNMLRIIEENNYYPFGLKHQNYNNTRLHFELINDEVILHQVPFSVGDGKYNYKFQGQERQEELGLNWDSFKWRNYSSDLGRFWVVDPLSESFYYNSPYAFAENKVISHIELEGLEGVHSSKLDAAGNRVHTIEKNVIVLTQALKAIPEGASAKEIEKIERKNERITNSNNYKVESVKEELKNFYSGAQNTSNETVNFEFNVTAMPVEDTNVKGGAEMTNLALKNGIDSSTILFEGGQEQTAPAAIISSAGSGGTHGVTNGVVVMTNYGCPEGTVAHEIGHTLRLGDDYSGIGVMASPPNHVSKKEVDEIIKQSYTKKDE